MQVRFETHPSGARRAVTVGLQEMGQTEFMLLMTPHVTDESGTRLLRYIGDYIAISGQHIRPNETMRYGWSTLRFTKSTNEPLLIIEELKDPFSAASSVYIAGADTAVSVLNEQDAAVQRNGIERAAHHPHRSEIAVICRHVTPTSAVLVFDRIKTTRADDSGWFVGCGNPDHDHNDTRELARMHLIYLAEALPQIVTYLAMPEDSRVVFENGKAIVFPPGEDDGRLDSAESLANR